MAVDDKMVLSRFKRARIKARSRDIRMSQILAIREGRMSEVAPDLFPLSGPYQEPIVANMIDVAARDTAEMIAPLPSISCTSPSMVSEKDQERADVRTKICMGIVSQSDLQVQMYSGADQYLSYGFLPGIVETDLDADQTIIRLVDPMGCYWDEDRFGRVTAFYQLKHVDPRDVCELYPEVGGQIREAFGTASGVEMPNTTEMLVYHDKHRDLIALPNCGGKSFVVSDRANKFGKIRVRIARRPGAPRPRGQYDDVMFVQLAKARFALLAMESANESVQSPLVVPTDVTDVPMGPGAVIHTDGDVRKLDMSTPREVWTQQGALDSELRMGSRYPEVRTGNTDSSVITGRGVQALMGTMDTQIRTASAVMARFLTELLSLSLEFEEFVYGDQRRNLTGTNSGVPFEVDYKPSKDIKGDYTVDVQYGLMAGLDPNRWLIFGLQARSEKLISRDYLRRQMPADFDAGDEERKIDVEDMRDAAKQAFAGLAQSIPAMAAQGQDPSQILAAVSAVVAARQKGTPIEEAIAAALAPPEPSPEEQAAQAAAAGGGAGGPGGGLGPDGLMTDVAPGQAGMAPGGRPDLRMALASFDSSGTPRMSVGVSRREAF